MLYVFRGRRVNRRCRGRSHRHVDRWGNGGRRIERLYNIKDGQMGKDYNNQGRHRDRENVCEFHV
jgi:hypothetical protein